jgi:hypothetical protein
MVAWLRNLTLGTVATGLLFGAVRLGVRLAFRETVSHHASTSVCGALVHRTTSATYQRPFDERPRVESESVLEGPSGDVVATGVRVTGCAYLPARAAFVTGEGQTVRVFDGPSFRVAVPVGFAPQTLVWSKDGSKLAALAPGHVAVLAGEGLAPVDLSRDARVFDTGAAWSEKGRFCFVVATPSGDQDGSAELHCTLAAGGEAQVARAAWAGRDARPWGAFHVEAPVLCGDELRPRNPDCFGLKRP